MIVFHDALLLAAKCPRCDSKEAFFMEIQTRSADEPASLFFRCTQCAQRWREG
jgi:DNA-directed RNA polymerase III subunit RPC11